MLKHQRGAIYVICAKNIRLLGGFGQANNAAKPRLTGGALPRRKNSRIIIKVLHGGAQIGLGHPRRRIGLLSPRHLAWAFPPLHGAPLPRSGTPVRGVFYRPAKTPRPLLWTIPPPCV